MNKRKVSWLLLLLALLAPGSAHADYEKWIRRFFPSGFASPASFTLGTGQGIGGGNFFQINPASTGSVPWNYGLAVYDNVGNPNKNNVLTFGWNCGMAGLIDPAKGGLCWTTESEFGPTGGAQMEHYIGFSNAASPTPDGGRIFTINAALGNGPLSVDIGLVGTRIGLGYASTNLSINDANRLVIDATTTSLRSASPAFLSTLTLAPASAILDSGAGGTLARLQLLPTGDVQVRALTGTLGIEGEAGGSRLEWGATASYLRGPLATWLVSANSTSVGFTGSSFSGNHQLGVDSGGAFAEGFQARIAGVRRFLFGLDGTCQTCLYGSDNTAWLTMGGDTAALAASSTGASLTQIAVTRPTGNPGDSAINLHLNGTQRWSFFAQYLLPKGGDGVNRIGADGERLGLVQTVAVRAAYLTDDGAGTSNFFVPTLPGGGNAEIRPVVTNASDPGNGGALPVKADCTMELFSGASGETRTLANPTYRGQLYSVALDTDGGGDIVITSANAFNQAGQTTITLNDAGDYVALQGVQINGGSLRWRVVANDGATLGP